MSSVMYVVDGHLDLALNALEFKRDLKLSLDQLRQRQTPEAIEKVGTPTVTFDQFKTGHIQFVVSTLIARAKPWASVSPIPNGIAGDWPTQDMAYAIAQGQLAWYRLMEQYGYLRIITTSQQLESHGLEQEAPLGVILTLEGADPIADPDQVHTWHAQGLRTLMLAHFGVSFYAHGTPSQDADNPHDIDGPLSPLGIELLKHIHALQMPLDLTHLSDQSFFEVAERFEGAIYSSHTACRSIVPIARNHSDEQLRIMVARDGVIGLPMFNHFLDPDSQPPPNSQRDLVTLDRVVDHVDHICQLAGSAKHVAIGSDLDGGFGREHVPHEIDSIADMLKLPGVLERRGFLAEDIQHVMGGNWKRFYQANLPST